MYAENVHVSFPMSRLEFFDVIGTGIPTDKFQKNVSIVIMRVILSRCVFVDVWLKRSFYTTVCEKHIATFATRLIKHFSSTGKHVSIPSDKMWQTRYFQYIKIQTWLRGLGDKQKKLHREKTNGTKGYYL